MMRRALVVLLCCLALGTHCIAADRVRLAVLGLFHPQQLSVEVSAAAPLVLSAAGKQLPLGVGATQQVHITRSGALVSALATGGHFRARTVQFAGRQGEDVDFVLAVPGKLHRRYYGRLTITATPRELIAVVEMPMETAVASIVAAELPATTPLEALKAQAVAARSYLSAAPRHAFADFCDTTHCQFLREPAAAGSPAARAAAETAGLRLAWQGKVFPALYSASCGGHTRSLAEAGLPARDYPYFAVECVACRRTPERWRSEVSREDAAALSSHGERERLRAARQLGWSKVPSSNFAQHENEDGVELIGAGRGHALGLCQRGAAAMAADGADFRAILAHYFPNTALTSGGE